MAVVGAVGALVLVVAVSVIGISSLVSQVGSDSSPAAEVPAPDVAAPGPATAADAVPPSVTDPACPTATIGAVSWGRDAGGTSDGVSAIKAFDYGYYVLRSGAKARELVAENAALIADAPTMQKAIDVLPVETAHCLQITDRGNGLYEVTLAEFRPGQSPDLTFQVIQTGPRDGRTVITAIPTNVSIGE